MKARVVLACTAAGIAASAFAGPIANADGFNGSITHYGGAVEPGYEIFFTGTCTDPNFNTSPLISPVLEPTVMSVRTNETGVLNLFANAKVKADAQPGVWPVSFTCGTTTVRDNIEVVAEPAVPKASVSVAPAKGIAGTKVTVSIICLDLAPVTSVALSIGEAISVPAGGEGRPYFEVTGKVKDVKPGPYKVSTTCGDEKISTTFTVLASKPAPVNAQVPVKPKKAPETGGGDA